MKIHSAGFGEVNGGHALLGCSDGERAKYSEIVSKTDKPGYAPPGLTWAPYISGFPWQSHYCILKTFPDNTASRSGMVFSYALLSSVNDISHCNDLRKLLDLLPAVGTKPTEYKTVEIWPEAVNDALHLDERLAECLVSAQPGESVVWLGEEGFVDAVVALWTCMWPETRAGFSFRLAFDPQDLDFDRPTFVLTPTQLESRWAKHSVVQRTATAATMAGAALAKRPEGEGLRALKQSIGAKILHPRELRLLEQVYSTLSATTIGTSQGRSALHLIGRLCPEPVTAGAEKSQLLQTTAAAIRLESDPAEIRAFRNLSLDAFDGAQTLLLAIEEWVSENVLRDPQDRALTGVLELAFEGQNYLSDRVRTGLRMSLQRQRENDGAILWAWVEAVPKHATDLIQSAISSGWNDSMLARSCPVRMEKIAGDALMPFTRERELPICHSAIATAILPPQEAIKSHLELGVSPTHGASVLLLERIGGAAAVQYAMKSSDETAVALAVEGLRSNVSLLPPPEFDNDNWLKLFTAAVRAKISLSEMLGNSSTSFKLFDFVIKGGEPEHDIWVALSESEFSNLSDYSQRAMLWVRIPPTVKGEFLSRTAGGWLESFASRPDAEHEMEVDLEPAVMKAVRGRHFDVATLIRLCYRLSDIDESLFIELLQRSLAAKVLTLFSAEKLGAFVSERKWGRAANHLFVWSDARTDLYPALAKCLHLLTRWQRLRATWLKNVNNVSHPTTDGLWTALEELGIELYSWGPGDRDIWERAGGDRAAIRVQTSGRDSWHDVISQARRGGGGNVSLRSLAAAMQEDYAWNDVLMRVSQLLGK